MVTGEDPPSHDHVAVSARVAIAIAVVGLSAAVINAVGFGSMSVCTSAADPDCGAIERWAWAGVAVTTITAVIGLAFADRRRSVASVLAFTASALTLTCAAMVAAAS